MKVIAAYAASFVLFWLGHSASKLMHYGPLWRLYPVYNRLMVWSIDVEDWAGIEFMWTPASSNGAERDADEAI